jgi:hypothetical protein
MAVYSLALNSLEDDHKALIAKYVTTKPAKAGVKVEV